MSNNKNLNPSISMFCKRLQAILNRNKRSSNKHYKVTFKGRTIKLLETIDKVSYSLKKTYSYKSSYLLLNDLVQIVNKLKEYEQCIKN